jgi:hypothetical protein
LSPKEKNLGSFKRHYSTNSNNFFGVENNKHMIFYSLEQGCEEIKFKFIGVSGVYKLTNKNDLTRFYIGSSNNLSRRMQEYNKLTKGLRTPHSLGELEISKTPSSEWNLEFIYLTSPQLSLVYEQYAIIMFKPTINSNFKVIPRINPQWGNHLDHAIFVIEKLLSLFTVGSDGYNRLYVFLQTFKTANHLKFEQEDIDNKYFCFLVFVYDISSPSKKPIIYSSINRTLKALQISHSTLLYHINNNYIYNSKFILSFEPVITGDFEKYTEKPVGDNQLRKHVAVYNLDNELVTEFKSGREMAKYFQIDGKIARAAIAKGEFHDFLLIAKEVSFRKTIYVFDSSTHQLIDKINGVSKALKYAKINYYTLKSLIENGNSFQGKIYSYKDKL